MSRTSPSPHRVPAQIASPMPPPPPVPLLSRRALWFAAVKPPMYTVAITPILVGSMAAYADTGFFAPSTLLSFLLAAICIIAWLNLCNDVFDFDTGIDVNKRESVVNLCGATPAARNALYALSLAFLAIAFSMLVSLSTVAGARDLTVLAVMAIAVAGGYMYQGPPFRLGYFGLGEPICFVGWALTVAAAYYSQLRLHHPSRLEIEADHPTLSNRVAYLLLHLLWSRDRYLCAAAVLVATPTTIILLCSHFHQIHDDARAGKRSPVVRLGTKGATVALELLCISLVVTSFIFRALDMLPARTFYISLLAIPYGVELCNFVRQNHDTPEAVRPAKYYAVKFHFVHGCLVSLGFMLSLRGETA